MDDLRSFTDGRPALVARTSADAIALLTRIATQPIAELWLDHDLGGIDTIWPVVEVLERAAFEQAPIPVATVFVHSANPVGAARVALVLRRWGYPVQLWPDRARWPTSGDSARDRGGSSGHGRVHRFHLGDRPAAGAGSLDVERGSSIPSRLIGAILRFHRTGRGQPVEVRITTVGDTEHWHRRIGGRSLDSSQRRAGDVVTEYAGPAQLRMRLDVTADGIALTPLLRIGPLRIPLRDALAPHTCATATATASDGFEVAARIWVPSIGLLIAYRGQVHEEEAANG